MVVLCNNLDFCAGSSQNMYEDPRICAGSPYIHFDNILLSRFGDEILKLALILTKAMFGISHPTRASKIFVRKSFIHIHNIHTAKEKTTQSEVLNFLISKNMQRQANHTTSKESR